MTRSSGFGTSQTSLTPERPDLRLAILGEVELADRRAREVAPACPRRGRWPAPSTSAPGSKLPSGSPSLPRPLSPERTPRTTPSSTSSCCARGLGQDVRARLLGLLGQPARQLGDARRRTLPWFLNGGGVGIERKRALRAQHPVDGVLVDLARSVGQSDGDRSGKSSCSPDGRMIAPDRLCAPHALPFSMTATGTSPRRSMSSGSSASSCRRRLAQARPAGPPPTIATPTSMRSSSSSSSRLMNSSARVDGRREGRRDHERRSRTTPSAQPPFRAFTASVSLGTILLRSPTMPRSENSKIGALASLLIATMFSEDCMPTLCWIAPEMPAAR